MLSHGNMLHNSAVIAHGFEHTRSGLGVFWLPSYHDMGLIGGIIQPLYVGRPNVIMSPMSFLQRPYRWLSAISRFRATTSGGPNFAFDLCVQKVTPEQMQTLDLSSWSVAFNGAEPVRAATIRRFTEKFAPCGFRPESFYPCYGMAETTLMVTGGLVHDRPVIRTFESRALTEGRAIPIVKQVGQNGVRDLVSSGQGFESQKVVIADPDAMTRCPDNQVGEIWVKGPSVAQGYWKQTEMTKAVFQARLKDTGDGPFLRTGDLGFLEGGELFVTGRIKDLIILHGVNHYPHDIERTVQRAHTRLRRDCGAVFTVEEDGKEKLVLVQEIDRRKQGKFDIIYDTIRRAVSTEHELGLDAIIFVRGGTVPKTSSGKIQRHACRDMYLSGALEAVDEWHRGEGDDALPPLESEPAVAETPEAAPAQEVTIEEVVLTDPASAAPPKTRVSLKDLTTEQVAQLVLEEVHKVAKERSFGLSLDMKITELGLDSLERVEILATLEERFGGRFPEEILPDLETARQVVAAVEEHLGSPELVSKHKALDPDAEIPTEYYHIAEFPEYIQLKQSLDMAEMMGLDNPFFTVHQGLTNDRTIIDGNEVINFSSYNYVGMSGDPVVTKAAQDAAAKYGTSVSASRLVSGEKDIHGEFEREVAEFVGVESSLCFVGGHATNETVVGHLVGPGDLILHDALAHNSILQGAILSGARRRPFPHNDFETADRILSEFRHEYRRVLIVIEGVYSMDGDYPDLPKFIELKKKHHALLMIDEAHSVGTLGETGRGIGEFFDIDQNDVDIWMSTLSKTFGSCGGYIAGRKELIEYLKYTAPGFVFSVGMPPMATAAALAAIRLLKKEPQRVHQLQARSKLFLELAKERGFNTGMSKDSPVIPVILGNSIHSLQLSNALLQRGINVQPILYPAVEESAARLRFFITSEHTEDQIRYTIDCMAEELEKIHPSYLSDKVK
jgi:8-amino-7-oxononanoate synthase/acyl carrier protein